MKKILIIAGFLVLATGGVFLYKWLTPHHEADPFRLVPEDAILIIETSRIYNVWESIKSKPLWVNLHAVPTVETLGNKIASLDTMLGENDKIDFFQNKKVVASLHAGAGKNPDYIFYIPLSSGKDERFLEKTLKNIKGQGKYFIEERNFKGYAIGSLTSKESKSSFNYLVYKDIFVGSFSIAMLEHFIDNLEKNNQLLFWKKNERSKKSSQGTTTLYLNYARFPELLSLFGNAEMFRPLTSFAEESVLEFNLNDRDLLLNGFTYPYIQKPSFISNFKGSVPQQFYVKHYVPNTTAALYYYGFDNGLRLRKSLEQFWAAQDPGYLKEVEEINQKYDIDIGSVYKYFGNEIGFCLSPGDTALGNRLILLHTPDPGQLIPSLDSVAIKTSGKKQKKMRGENWKGTTIKKMGVPEFPTLLLGKIFSGFPDCYYAALDNYVVFSNTEQGIKDLIQDIEAENVWGKTLAINSSLEGTITEFNVGLFVNVKDSWETMLKYGTPDARKEWLKNKKLIEGFDFLAMQFSHFNESVLTNIILTHNLSEPVAKEQERAPAPEELHLDKVRPYFYLAESKNPGKDLFYQDSTLVLHKVGSDLRPIWKFPLKDTLSGIIFTIDIDKDRKWDCVFAAGNQIYALNSKGEPIKNYPINLRADTRVSSLSVMDYNNTKEYRLVAADQNGHIYFFDTKGNNLDGWKPKKLGGEILDKVKHLRVGDKDVILCIQKNGTVNALNRRGEMYPGFPLDLKSGKLISFAIRKGGDFEKTIIYVQSGKGEVISFNLKGKTVKNENKGSMICADPKGNSFVTIRGNPQEIMIERASGKSLTLPFVTDRISVRYYNLSTKGEFVSVKDNSEGKLFIYNLEQGKEMITELQSDMNSEIFYNEKNKQYGLYNFRQGKLEVISF